MKELVVFRSNDTVTTSLIIAEGTGLQHHSITRIIRNKKKRFERFGKIQFMDLKSINPLGGRPARVYALNEMQATLLMTYLDNSEVVDDFKEELVRQFYAMRTQLMKRATADWVESRRLGILCRKNETDVIKQLVEYAKEQKSNHAEMLYMTYSNLANKAVGIKPKMREYATVDQLNCLKVVERIITKIIKAGINEGKHYKQIYKDCKERVEQYLEIAFIDDTLLLS